MHDLQLVGFTTDRRGLIFRTQAGARVESYVVPLTDELVRLVTQLAGSAADDEPPAVPDEAVEPVVAVAEPRAESQLSVRDIQARLRAGEPIARVAAEAGVGDDWIERFAPPIRAEQRRVVERALESHLQRSRAGTSAVPLRRAVGIAMADKGIAFTVAAFEAAWSARLLGQDRWAVEFTYRHRGQDRTATWDFDTTTDSLTSNDRAASQIGFVDPDGMPDDDIGIEVDGIVGAPDAKTQIGTALERPKAAPQAAPAATTKATTGRAPTKRAPARKKASAKKAKASAKKAATTSRSTAATTKAKSSTVKKAATRKKAAAAEKAATAKKAATAGKATSKKPTAAKRAATTKKGAAATRAATPKKAATQRKSPPARATSATGRATGSGNVLIAKTARTRASVATGEAPPAAVRSAAASKRTVADTKRPIDEVAASTTAPDPSARPSSNGSPTPAATPASVVPASVPEPRSPEALDRLRADRVSERLAEERDATARPTEPPAASSASSPPPADADRTAARRARAAERSAPTVQFRSGSAAPVRVVGATETTSTTPAPSPAAGAPADGSAPNGRLPDPGTRADEPAPAPPSADANGAARPRARRRRQLRAR